MKTNLSKAGRDLLVLLVATAAFYVSTNVANFGLPEEIAPVVGTAALLIYRTARSFTQTAPPTE